MTPSSPCTARADHDIVSRLLRPLGVLLMIVVLLGIGAFWWTCNLAEDAALQRQRERVVSSVANEVAHAKADLERTLARYPSSAAFKTALSTAAATDPTFPAAEFDQFVVVSPLGDVQLVRAREGSEVDDLALKPLLANAIDAVAGFRLRTTPADTVNAVRPVAFLDGHAGEASLVTAIRVRDVWPSTAGDMAGSVVVGIVTWNDVKLRSFASIWGLSGLSVRPSGSEGSLSSVPFDGLDSPGDASLAWQPDTSAARIKERLASFVGMQVCVALGLFYVISTYIRRAVRDLAKREVLSKELSARDSLSGLANRLLFNERLDRELTAADPSGPRLAVMFIDLDRFKDVNDTYGHQAGDDLIRLVAHRLAELMTGGETLARLGGDEFAIIQPNLRSTADAEALARLILDHLTRPFPLDQSPVLIGASIGIALAPEHGRDRETLMRLADTALYQAKSEGRNRFCLFQSQMDETLRMRKTVEEDLRRAIQADQLALHYQPLFSPDGETIVGLEALVRWPHPVQGLIAPSDFISIAEERGLIIPLGEWVLRRACQDGKRWPGLRIAVNVSAIQFRHKDYVASVVRVLDETGFDPSRLELELTEGVVVGDADAAEAAMVDLRALGIHLALDDFGTGYSSLIYLRRFAFDKIKIDRSFLESMEVTGESAILVHSIVHLGRALGLTVTAEGVETRDQHRFLQALGCHQLQGYLFSRPVPASEIDKLVAPASGRTLSASAA